MKNRQESSATPQHFLHRGGPLAWQNDAIMTQSLPRIGFFLLHGPVFTSACERHLRSVSGPQVCNGDTQTVFLQMEIMVAKQRHRASTAVRAVGPVHSSARIGIMSGGGNYLRGAQVINEWWEIKSRNRTPPKLHVGWRFIFHICLGLSKERGARLNAVLVPSEEPRSRPVLIPGAALHWAQAAEERGYLWSSDRRGRAAAPGIKASLGHGRLSAHLPQCPCHGERVRLQRQVSWGEGETSERV